MEAAGYSRLEQLTKVTEAELGQLHGMGPKALGILRETLKEKGLSFKAGTANDTPKKKKGSPVSRTDKVDEFLENLSHPLKAEVEAVRSIIKGVNKDINEEIKWKAPSFNYKGEYLVTFNLRDEKRIHLVFHNPQISKVKSKLLEGDYKDRRMAYFADMKDVKAKKSMLGKSIERFDQITKIRRIYKMALTPSQEIDKFIKELTDWRGKWIAQFRDLILKTAPEVTEEWKWGVPVWSYKGNVVASGVFKDHVKLNFFKGASLSDPKHLFNAGLEAKATRAIDIGEGDKIDESALKELIRAAVDFNKAGGKKK